MVILLVLRLNEQKFNSRKRYAINTNMLDIGTWSMTATVAYKATVSYRGSNVYIYSVQFTIEEAIS